MSSDRTGTLHYVVRTCILFAFAMYIVFLVKSDNILFYIAPRMVIYVKLAAIGLYAVAVYQGFLAFMALRGKIQECHCEHPPSSSKIKNTILYSLFIFPLLLGFLMPNSAMGSTLAAKKGVNLNSSSSIRASNSNIKTEKQIDQAILKEQQASGPALDPLTGQTQPGSGKTYNKPNPYEMFASDQFTELYAKQGKKLYKQDFIQIQDDIFIETLTTLDLYKDNFIGKKMEISGFVYREDTMPKNQFVVARFAVQCCSADAAPYGVLVELPKAANYKSDNWVKVTGIIEKSTMNDMDVIKLKVQNIEKIEMPVNPYIYPNYEFEP